MQICKELKYNDGPDNRITVGEIIVYTIKITVKNASGDDWKGAIVTDTFGSDLNLSDNFDAITEGLLTQTTTNPKGKGTGTQKWKLNWNIGHLANGLMEELTLTAFTDVNPGGNQEYTSCGEHVVNGGANLKIRNSANKSQSFNTGIITVNVACP